MEVLEIHDKHKDDVIHRDVRRIGQNLAVAPNSGHFTPDSRTAQRRRTPFRIASCRSASSEHINPSPVVEDVKRQIFNARGIETLRDVDWPLRLEGLRRFDLGGGEAHKDRPRVSRVKLRGQPIKASKTNSPSIFISAMPARPSVPGTATP